MKKNKILALCLAVLMAAGLAGCGSSAGASDVPDGDGDPPL